jgi:hypothetical protein
MANASLLFYDGKQTVAADVMAFRDLHKECLPDVPLQTINFFSSKFEDLQLISKHRVVSLPTYVSVNTTNKVAFRIAGRLPTANNLDMLNSEGTGQ